MKKLYLELPTIKRENDAMNYIIEFYENGSVINGSGSLSKFINLYEDWLKKVKEDLNNPKNGRVPANTYFAIRESDNKIVGMVNIRHSLCEYSDRYHYRSGHIGYSVRPTERRKGYGTQILSLALEKCKELNIEEVQLSCYEYNIGSYKAIEKNGGKLIRNITDGDNVPCRCYVIKNK